MQYEIIEHIQKSTLELKFGIQSIRLNIEHKTSPLTDDQIISSLERLINGIIIRRLTDGEMDIYEENIQSRGTWHRLLTVIPTKIQFEKIKELFTYKLEDRVLTNGLISVSLSKIDSEFLPILKILSGYSKLQIPIEKEPEEITKEFRGAIEDCFFCHIPTLWWHMASNTPVCPDCANKRFISELPKHRMTLINEDKYG